MRQAFMYISLTLLALMALSACSKKQQIDTACDGEVLNYYYKYEIVESPDSIWGNNWVPVGFACSVPNAFTPNGDGLNDILRPLYTHKDSLEAVKVTIYEGNRPIYQTDDIDWSWDGSDDNGDVKIGSYRLAVAFKFPNEAEYITAEDRIAILTTDPAGISLCYDLRGCVWESLYFDPGGTSLRLETIIDCE